MKFYILLRALLFASSFKLFTTAMGRNMTVTNHCPFTIWCVSTFTAKLCHFYQHFFRPAVGICFGIIHENSLRTRLTRGMARFLINQLGTVAIQVSPIVGFTPAECVSVGLPPPIPPFRSRCLTTGPSAKSGYLLQPQLFLVDY